MPGQEVICIRVLASSDMGWFAAHRPTTPSKQRAININANVAARLLSDRALMAEGVELASRCVFPGAEHVLKRTLWKVGKNWRFGGPKLEGDVFKTIVQGDLLLLKSPIHNDGDKEISFTFVSITRDKTTYEWLTQREPQLLVASMTVAETGSDIFNVLTAKCFSSRMDGAVVGPPTIPKTTPKKVVDRAPVPPMPRDSDQDPKPRSMHERIRSPHILAQMLKVSADLSAESHYEFVQVIELLADQLRRTLLAAGMIKTVRRDHPRLWADVRGSKIAFVDGGMANLSMLGSAPIAARVGGYIVTPGHTEEDREQFVMVKHLIDELYSPPDGVFSGMFPDIGALRDAARISVEAAGAVHIVEETPGVRFMFLHGALINPASRYTDIMEGGQTIAAFPDFSPQALKVLLPSREPARSGRDANFVRVYLRQLQLLEQSDVVISGVVERESQATSVYKELIETVIQHPAVPPLLPKSANEWASWFIQMAEQFRISDVLLFRCVLEAGEVLQPVEIDRNEIRRAPNMWKPDIQQYPRPWVSYMLPTEWGHPIRVECFAKDVRRFDDIARLVMHCAWLLPRYAFPVGLDIVDKYAKVPNWMARPINTNTAVQALRRALDSKDTTTFDALRRMLCGSTRDWLFRPKLT